MICFKFEHPANASAPIEVIDDGIMIRLSVEYLKSISDIFFSFNNK